MGFTTGARGIALIKSFESCRLESYPDIVGVWTIGWGHTSANVRPGMTITQADADNILAHDLQRFEEAVNHAVTWKALTHFQFDACVCLAFNIGVANFSASHLVRDLNAGDIQGAADQFLVWDHAGGKVVPGLLRRRTAERALFLAS